MWPHGSLSSPVDDRLSVHEISQARVSCHFLLQGIFLAQGSNPSLLHSFPPGKPIFREVDLIKYAYILNFLMFGLFLLLYISSLVFFSTLNIYSLLYLVLSPQIELFFLKKAPDLYELQIWQNLDLSVNLRLCLVMLKFNHTNALFFLIISKYKYHFLFFLKDIESSTERKTACYCCLKNELFLFSFLKFQK